MSATAQDSGPVLLAVNVGQPKDVDGPGGQARTAVWKAPVSGRRRVGQLNVDGDLQADLVGHGGPHRAVLVYQAESYRYWEGELGRVLPGTGVFGAAGRSAPAWPGLRPFTVRARTTESSDIASFELVPQDAAPLPAHLPGQFVTVAVPGLGGQGDLTGSYSLSQAARPDRLRISVKRSRVGSAGRRLHDEVAAGDPVRLAAPRGTFTLDVAATGPVVLLSAGVGVTPVLAMLDALAAGASRRPVWWVHVARNSSEHPHAAQAQTLLDRLTAAHRHLRYTRPLPTDRLGVDFDATGRLRAGDLAALDLPVEADCYLCGPPGFLTDVPTALRAQGRQPGRVHVEGFGAPAGDRPDPHPPATTGSGPQVVFARSGLTVRWPQGPATLLELAESCDVPADWSCRTGICHRCQTPLVDGSVTYDPEPIDPPADGTVLICCSRPAADLVLDL